MTIKRIEIVSYHFTDDKSIMVQIMAWCLIIWTISWTNVDKHHGRTIVIQGQTSFKQWSGNDKAHHSTGII